MKEPLDLHNEYLLIADSDLEPLAADGFWERLFSDADFNSRVGAGWLVAAFEVNDDWASWEMHPQADEVVHVTGGRLEVILDDAGSTRTLSVSAGETLIVPAGVWHTIDVVEPGGTLNITHGDGTRHRPRSDDE